MNRTYLDTARTLVQVAPLVFRDSPFALKGGTAINLFVRDMPRLSVDLDVVFTNRRLAREAALTRINDVLVAAADRLQAHRFTVRKQATNETGDTKLFVRRGNIEVKVEVDFVLRGTLSPALRDISHEYERTFAGMTAEPVELSDLLATRAAMVVDLNANLSPDDRKFLLSVARAEPDWRKTPYAHASELPALQ